MSKFNLSPTFISNLFELSTGIEDITFHALDQAMQEASTDAKAEARWRKEGEYVEVDQAGNTWEWDVTGVARDSITAFTVSPNNDSKNLPSSSAHSLVTKTTPDGFITIYDHDESTDDSNVVTPSPTSGEIIGVLTMTSDKAEYIQGKEIAGGEWGIPDPGQPITIETLEANIDHYTKNIITPQIAVNIQTLARSLK